jgi:hypothetical protein
MDTFGNQISPQVIQAIQLSAYRAANFGLRDRLNTVAV